MGVIKDDKKSIAEYELLINILTIEYIYFLFVLRRVFF